MDNGIDKKALFKLKSEPYLKPISDLGVGFYNLDENTAILRFQLSNTKGPLLVHENNLTAYAYFESDNGSASDVIELEIEDAYVPRSERPEWNVVGLVGQVFTRIDETVSVNDYIKPQKGIGTKDNNEGYYRVLEITTPYNTEKGYGVAVVLVK